MTPKAFVKAYRAGAVLASKATGILPGVILAQWANESGWGTSGLAVKCHNLAGIRYYSHAGTTNAGGFSCYAYIMPNGINDGHTAFVTDYIATIKLPYYRKVRKAVGAAAQIAALGASPWSASHYGKPAGAHLLTFYHALAAYL